MAILTQADYWPHVARMFRRAINDDPALLPSLLPGLIQYARVGVDQRTAVRMLIGWWWRTVQGKPHHAHMLHHILLDAGVPDQFAEEIPEIEEPGV